jgi:internalin A
MKRALYVAGLALLLTACEDQEQKKKELLQKTGVLDAATATSAAPETKAAPTATAQPKQAKVCPEGKDVPIDDVDIDEDIRKRLNKPKDKNPTLTTADLAQVSSLNIAKKTTLDELDPCIFPKLTGLKHLYLGKGQLRDLSPISGLTQLESLIAPANEVEDLKPIEKLVKLDRLDISKTRVKDITPIGTLVNLTEIQMDDTPIVDELKTLTVKGSPIENLDVLAPQKGRGLKIITN